RRAGENAVEDLGIALGDHQGLTSAVRATDEVAEARHPAVERLGQHLGRLARYLERAIAVVGYPFRRAGRPTGVEAVRADVARVCRRGDRATAHLGGQSRLRDRSGKAARAQLDVATVPRAQRQPNLDADSRALRGPQLRL